MEDIFRKAGEIVRSFKEGFKGLTAVNVSKVINDIEECNIYVRYYPSEKDCEQTILKFLRSKSGYNNVHQQFSVGGNLALKIDLDIDERIGVEIKMAEELLKNASNAQRLLGQALYYSKRKYNENVIVVVIGSSKNQNEPMIKELKLFIEQDLGLTFLYKLFK